MAVKDPLEQEWLKLEKQEQKFVNERIKDKPSVINEKIDKHLPEKLRGTLNSAFNKAFGIIFKKGTGIIEKTYDREQYEMDYKINEYAYELKSDKKRLKGFAKKAGGAKKKNMAISCASGVGLGLLGCGIPDIPLFTSSVLKSVYETALSFGYDYESEEERLFILKVIEIAMKQGIDFAEDNTELNKLIDRGEILSGDLNKQVEETAQVLTDAMIYMKFIQGMFIIGAVGGAYDVIYMNRITNYAILKYKRRFLINKSNSINN